MLETKELTYEFLDECFKDFSTENTNLRGLWNAALDKKGSRFLELSEESLGITDKKEFIRLKIKSAIYDMLYRSKKEF